MFILTIKEHWNDIEQKQKTFTVDCENSCIKIQFVYYFGELSTQT